MAVYRKGTMIENQLHRLKMTHQLVGYYAWRNFGLDIFERQTISAMRDNDGELNVEYRDERERERFAPLVKRAWRILQDDHDEKCAQTQAGPEMRESTWW
jgi:hypothetical protein